MPEKPAERRLAAFPAWSTLFAPFLAAFWFLYGRFGRHVHWPSAWRTVLVFELVLFPAEAFSVWRGHWVYNDARIIGIKWLGVPIEEPLLYYLFSPLIIVTIYEAFRGTLAERRP